MSTPELDQDLDLSDPPSVVPALLLPATLLARDALLRLLVSQADVLAVRRIEGLTVYWYSFPMAWALNRVRQGDPQATLKRVLDLHEFLSAPVRSADAGALQPALDRDAVVLDGNRFVGLKLDQTSSQNRSSPARSERAIGSRNTRTLCRPGLTCRHRQ
jgi:hypothetical protein